MRDMRALENAVLLDNLFSKTEIQVLKKNSINLSAQGPV